MKKLPMNLDINMKKKDIFNILEEIFSGTLSDDNHCFVKSYHAGVDWLVNHNKVDTVDAWSDICKAIIHNLIVFNRTDNDISDLSKDELKSIIEDNNRFYRMLNATLKRASLKCQKALATKPSDDYDTMSKEELIALLRNRK